MRVGTIIAALIIVGLLLWYGPMHALSCFVESAQDPSHVGRYCL